MKILNLEELYYKSNGSNYGIAQRHIGSGYNTVFNLGLTFGYNFKL